MTKALGGLFCVYEHWRADEDRCFYVGKGVAKRPFALSRRNVHHKRIQAFLAALGLAVDVRIVASGLTEAEAFALERERIARWRAEGHKLANLTDGGEGTHGIERTAETRRRISEAAKRRGISEATRAAHAAAMPGRKQSPEVIEHRAAQLRGRAPSAETREKIAASRRGMTFSDETRQRLSAAHKGNGHTPESRAKVSAAAKARWAADPQRCLGKRATPA